MALSLALCATVAFAQMPKSARVDRAANEVKTKVSATVNDNEMQRQDAYKGSIFTKAPLLTVDFNTQNVQCRPYKRWRLPNSQPRSMAVDFRHNTRSSVTGRFDHARAFRFLQQLFSCRP